MKYYAGFDLGGSNNRIVLADETGKFITDIFAKTNDIDHGPLGISQQMTGLMAQCASSKNISLDDIVGVGISSAGPLDLEEFGGCIRGSTNIKFPDQDTVDLENLPKGYMYKGQPLIKMDAEKRVVYIPLVDPIKDFLREKTRKDISISLGNDVNTAVIGVVKFGEGKDDPHNDMNYTVVATTHGAGFGAGVWTRGGVMEGHYGNAAECGHFEYKENGRPCGCGHYGCAEAYGSGTGVRENAKEKIAENGYNSEIYTRAKRLSLAKGVTIDQIKEDQNIPLKEVTSELVFEVYKNSDDKIANDVVQDAIKAIGKAYADITKAYNPKMIVTFGGITKNWDMLKDGIEREMKARVKVEVPELKRTVLEDDVGLYGAIGRAMGYGK